MPDRSHLIQGCGVRSFFGIAVSKIFLSYRRSDSQDVAGRIFDHLVAKYTRDSVFKDTDNIPLGVSYPTYLREKLQKAKVVFVIIGPNWVNATGKGGKRRLDDPADPVRNEIETALELGLPIIPIMVSNATIPTAADLPESLKQLVLLNGQPVRADPDFHVDIARLTAKLNELFGPDLSGTPISPAKDRLGLRHRSAIKHLRELQEAHGKLTEAQVTEAQPKPMFKFTIGTKIWLSVWVMVGLTWIPIAVIPQWEDAMTAAGFVTFFYFLFSLFFLGMKLLGMFFADFAIGLGPVWHARAALDAKVSYLETHFPEEVQHWGGHAVLQDADSVSVLLRDLEGS